MQFQQGKFKGRIFIAANHSAGDPQPHFEDYLAHGFYTDDHGKTFKLGDNVSFKGGKESMATELSNNKLMMNPRNQKGDIRARIISVSSNGGASWDTSYFDHTLIDPVNQGSILTLGKGIIAFCNAADTKRRDNQTLRISFDEGKTWQRNYTVDKSPDGMQKDFTAYSDMVKMTENKIGILYERNGRLINMPESNNQAVFSLIAVTSLAPHF